MEKINDSQVEHLADLSALSLSSQEKTKMKADLKQIVTFVDKIESVDTSLVMLNSKTISLSDLREDKVTESISQQEALKNAPASENGAYVVSKVVD